MSRRALVAVVGTLLLALVGSSLAQASAVTIATRLKPFSTSQSRCTSQTVAVTNAATSSTTSSVVVSTLDTVGCAGKALVVTVYDPAVGTWPAARRFVASSTVGAAATVTLTGTVFTPTAGLAVHVSVGGWQVPAAWSHAPLLPLISCTVPDKPTATCSVRPVDGSIWGSPPSDYLGRVAITTTSTTPVRWRVTMNLSDAGGILPFVAKALQDVQGGLVLIGTSGCAASPRTVTVEGTTTWGAYHTVVAGQTRELQVHGFAANQPTPMLLNCP